MTNKYLTLENRIKAEITSVSGKMSIYANDFCGNIISIDADEKFETASTVKVFILAEFFNQVEKGIKSLDDILIYDEKNFINGSGILRSLDMCVQMTSKNIATLMIIVSDNIATNMMIEYLGIDNINSFIKSLGLTDTILHNKIDFEQFSQLGTSTPKEYGFMFEQIIQEKLISKNASEQMLEILRKQHYNNMLIKSFPHYFLDSENTGDEEIIFIGSKSGSMNACRNDGGIITTPYGSYVLVMFTKEFQDPLYYSEHESTVFGSKVSRLIFDNYISLEGKFKL